MIIAALLLTNKFNDCNLVVPYRRFSSEFDIALRPDLMSFNNCDFEIGYD